MIPTKIVVHASAVRVGDVLCFVNPKSEVTVEAIIHREMDGGIGFRANNDTWLSYYRLNERLTVLNRKGLVPVKSKTCRYGAGGALVTDEPLDDFDLAPLPDEAAMFYGGKYLIAESMSLKTAQQIARSLGLVMFQG